MFSAEKQAYTALHLTPLDDAFLLLWNDTALAAAVITRSGSIAAGPDLVADTTGSYARGFAADGTTIVNQHFVEHPTRVSRIFTQTLDWSSEPPARRRSVR